MKTITSLAGVAAGAGILLGATTAAHAHINMLAPLTGRGGDQKASPCEGRPRGTPFTFEPGATIELAVDEALAHDGYFRISFDDDGQDDFKDPVSIAPINPARLATAQLIGTPTARADNPRCLADPADKCGESDFCNVVSTTGGATVLWDNLDPHLAADKKDWRWTIKLPDVECDNCTIQVMQVMEDIAYGAHGPFDGQADLYYRCIDITLKRGAGTAGPGNVPPAAPLNGIDCTKAEMMDDGGVMLPDSGVVVVTPEGDAGVGTDGGVANPPQGGTTGGGTAAGGTASGGAAGGTGGPGVGPVDAPAAAEDDGCSVGFGASDKPGAWLGMGLLALGLILKRRRRLA